MTQNILPKHVAIIMDGNGRWAKQKNYPRIRGHMAGINVIKKTVRLAAKLDIKILTLYAFSKENWRRPKSEVSGLMRLLKMYLQREIDIINKENIRLNVIGDIDGMPQDVQNILRRAMHDTRTNTGLLLNLALNYGARSEIIQAAKKIAEGYKHGRITLEEINEDSFSGYLYTAGLPDPDLLIRTSGEMRISNFLLWQCSYSEFYFVKKLWPDFNEDDFKKAIAEYQKRHRRFGGI